MIMPIPDAYREKCIPDGLRGTDAALDERFIPLCIKVLGGT